MGFVIAFLGIVRAGTAQVNVNPRYTPREPARHGRLRRRPQTGSADDLHGRQRLVRRLDHAPGLPTVDWSRLKLVVGGGSAVVRATSDRWKAITGSFICEGSSTACPRARWARSCGASCATRPESRRRCKALPALSMWRCRQRRLAEQPLIVERVRLESAPSHTRQAP